MPVTERIKRKSLHGELVGLIRDMILDGSLRPNEKIPEKDLCERFDVSRTPLREALKVLAAEGLLVLLPNRGARVAMITPEEVQELFPIMGALEALAGELACARITDTDLSELHRLHDQMILHYRNGEAAAYSKYNKAIHDRIFDIAANASLTSMYNSLMLRIHNVRYVARKSPERWEEAVDDHIRILEALDARDGCKVAALLREHLEHKADMVGRIQHCDRRQLS